MLFTMLSVREPVIERKRKLLEWNVKEVCMQIWL